MGKIKSKSYGFCICFITGLLVGTLIGTVTITILISYRMDQQYKKIIFLENTIQDRNEKLEKLESSINSYAVVLKNIEIHILDNKEIDELDKIDIEKAIKEKYTTLLGKEVKTMDPDILVEVVDKRILKIDKKEYRVNIKKLILTESLKIYVDVRVVNS